MAVFYYCRKCGEGVQYSPADDEEDPHQCPCGLLMALVAWLGVVASE